MAHSIETEFEQWMEGGNVDEENTLYLLECNVPDGGKARLSLLVGGEFEFELNFLDDGPGLEKRELRFKSHSNTACMGPFCKAANEAVEGKQYTCLGDVFTLGATIFASTKLQSLPSVSACGSGADLETGMDDGEVNDMEFEEDGDDGKEAEEEDEDDDYDDDDYEFEGGEDDNDGEDTDFMDDSYFTTDWDMKCGRLKKRYQKKLEELRECGDGNAMRSNAGQRRQANQIFTEEEAFGVLTNELFQIMARAEETGIDVTPVDDNVFHWRVTLSRFTPKSDLDKDLTELKDVVGYNYIEMQMVFTSDLYPFFPPHVTFVRPKLLGRAVLEICRMQALKLSHWQAARPVLELLFELKDSLQQHARVDVASDCNIISEDMATVYSQLEHFLMRLVMILDTGSGIDDVPGAGSLCALHRSVSFDPPSQSRAVASSSSAVAKSASASATAASAGATSASATTADAVPHGAAHAAYHCATVPEKPAHLGSDLVLYGYPMGNTETSAITKSFPAFSVNPQFIPAFPVAATSSSSSSSSSSSKLVFAGKMPSLKKVVAAGVGGSGVSSSSMSDSATAGAGVASASGSSASVSASVPPSSKRTKHSYGLPSGTGYDSHGSNNDWKLSKHLAAQEEKEAQLMAVVRGIAKEILKLSEPDCPNSEYGVMQVTNSSLLQYMLSVLNPNNAFLEITRQHKLIQPLLDMVEEFGRQEKWHHLVFDKSNGTLFDAMDNLAKEARVFVRRVEKYSEQGTASFATAKTPPPKPKSRHQEMMYFSSLNMPDAQKKPTAGSEDGAVDLARRFVSAMDGLRENTRDSASRDSLSGCPVCRRNPSAMAARTRGEATRCVPIEERYCQEMRPRQLVALDEGHCSYRNHKYKTQSEGCTPSKETIIRVANEMSSLPSSLPLDFSSSIFVRTYEDDILCAKALIVGPDDTPYAGGCFEFDIFFKDAYPMGPPLVNIITTGGGSVRFNPNLYNCGKVCLSLLGTWQGASGETWNARSSTLRQVLISIQSLILVPEPYFNEPGHESSYGTPAASEQSEKYTANIRVQCVRHAMLGQIASPPAAFTDVVHRHFYLRKESIINAYKPYAKELNAQGKLYEQLVSKLNSLDPPPPDPE